MLSFHYFTNVHGKNLKVLCFETAIWRTLNSTGRGALFRHFCVSRVITTAHAHKNGELSNKKKIKALRPKMKIASRGGGPALKHLADKLSEKTEEPYCTTMRWLQCRLGFALTRSPVMCLRGSWSRTGQPRCEVEPALASTRG